MLKAIRGLSQDTLIYGIGNFTTRLIPFLLIPFLTRILTPAEFAVQALFYMAIAFLMELVRLGLDIALLRYYVPEKNLEKQKAIFSSIFWASFIITGAISTALWFGAEFWTTLIVEHDGPYPHWMFYTLRLCAGIIWFDNMLAFPMTVMRCENRPRRFMLTRLIGVMTHASLTFILLFKFGRGIPGMFEANLIASGLTLLLCLPTILSRIRFAFDKEIFISCLMFGLPNVPNVLFVQVIDLSSRKFIEVLRSASESGLFAAGAKLGTFMAIVAMGFRLAWQPFFMRIKDQPDAREVFGRVLTYLMAIVMWLYLGLTAFMMPLAKWEIPYFKKSLIQADFWPGLEIFPIVSLAHVFNAMFAVFIVGIYLKNKMKVLPLITGIAAIVNFFGNLWLVPTYGMWASAWLTVVSYFIMAVLLYLYVQRIYTVPYEWGRILHISIVSAAVFFAGWFGRQHGTEIPGYILSVIFPVILLLTGLANKSELARIGIGIKRDN
ncbi:MAG: oligosaccharide flippase family protein [Calditrichaeota bacterium]|nr:oligosaccharide flippase family protein [Calditrichota bacterium]